MGGKARWRKLKRVVGPLPQGASKQRFKKERTKIRDAKRRRMAEEEEDDEEEARPMQGQEEKKTGEEEATPANKKDGVRSVDASSELSDDSQSGEEAKEETQTPDGGAKAPTLVEKVTKVETNGIEDLVELQKPSVMATDLDKDFDSPHVEYLYNPLSETTLEEELKKAREDISDFPILEEVNSKVPGLHSSLKKTSSFKNGHLGDKSSYGDTETVGNSEKSVKFFISDDESDSDTAIFVDACQHTMGGEDDGHMMDEASGNPGVIDGEAEPPMELVLESGDIELVMGEDLDVTDTETPNPLSDIFAKESSVATQTSEEPIMLGEAIGNPLISDSTTQPNMPNIPVGKGISTLNSLPEHNDLDTVSKSSTYDSTDGDSASRTSVSDQVDADNVSRTSATGSLDADMTKRNLTDSSGDPNALSTPSATESSDSDSASKVSAVRQDTKVTSATESGKADSPVGDLVSPTGSSPTPKTHNAPRIFLDAATTTSASESGDLDALSKTSASEYEGDGTSRTSVSESGDTDRTSRTSVSDSEGDLTSKASVSEYSTDGTSRTSASETVETDDTSRTSVGDTLEHTSKSSISESTEFDTESFSSTTDLSTPKEEVTFNLDVLTKMGPDGPLEMEEGTPEIPFMSPVDKKESEEVFVEIEHDTRLVDVDRPKAPIDKGGKDGDAESLFFSLYPEYQPGEGEEVQENQVKTPTGNPKFLCFRGQRQEQGESQEDIYMAMEKSEARSGGERREWRTKGTVRGKINKIQQKLSQQKKSEGENKNISEPEGSSSRQSSGSSLDEQREPTSGTSDEDQKAKDEIKRSDSELSSHATGGWTVPDVLDSTSSTASDGNAKEIHHTANDQDNVVRAAGRPGDGGDVTEAMEVTEAAKEEEPLAVDQEAASATETGQEALELENKTNAVKDRKTLVGKARDWIKGVTRMGSKKEDAVLEKVNDKPELVNGAEANRNGRKNPEHKPGDKEDTSSKESSVASETRASDEEREKKSDTDVVLVKQNTVEENTKEASVEETDEDKRTGSSEEGSTESQEEVSSVAPVDTKDQNPDLESPKLEVSNAIVAQEEVVVTEAVNKEGNNNGNDNEEEKGEEEEEADEEEEEGDEEEEAGEEMAVEEAKVEEGEAVEEAKEEEMAVEEAKAEEEEAVEEAVEEAKADEEEMADEEGKAEEVINEEVTAELENTPETVENAGDVEEPNTPVGETVTPEGGEEVTDAVLPEDTSPKPEEEVPPSTEPDVIEDDTGVEKESPDEVIDSLDKFETKEEITHEVNTVNGLGDKVENGVGVDEAVCTEAKKEEITEVNPSVGEKPNTDAAPREHTDETLKGTKDKIKHHRKTREKSKSPSVFKETGDKSPRISRKEKEGKGVSKKRRHRRRTKSQEEPEVQTTVFQATEEAQGDQPASVASPAEDGETNGLPEGEVLVTNTVTQPDATPPVEEDQEKPIEEPGQVADEKDVTELVPTEQEDAPVVEATEEEVAEKEEVPEPDVKEEELPEPDVTKVEEVQPEKEVTVDKEEVAESDVNVLKEEVLPDDVTEKVEEALAEEDVTEKAEETVPEDVTEKEVLPEQDVTDKVENALPEEDVTKKEDVLPEQEVIVKKEKVVIEHDVSVQTEEVPAASQPAGESRTSSLRRRRSAKSGKDKFSDEFWKEKLTSGHKRHSRHGDESKSHGSGEHNGLDHEGSSRTKKRSSESKHKSRDKDSRREKGSKRVESSQEVQQRTEAESTPAVPAEGEAVEMTTSFTAAAATWSPRVGRKERRSSRRSGDRKRDRKSSDKAKATKTPTDEHSRKVVSEPTTKDQADALPKEGSTLSPTQESLYKGSDTVLLEIKFPEGISMPRSPSPQIYTWPRRVTSPEGAPVPFSAVSDEGTLQIEIPQPTSTDSGTVLLEIKFPEGIAMPPSPIPQQYTWPKKPTDDETPESPLTVSDETKVQTEVPEAETPVSQAQDVTSEPALLLAPSATLQPEEVALRPLLSPILTLRYPEGISQPLSPPRPLLLEIKFPEEISMPRSPVPQKYTCPKKPSTEKEASEPVPPVLEEAKAPTAEVPRIESPVPQTQEVLPEPTLLTPPSVTLRPEEGMTKPLLSPTFTLKYPEGISQPLSPPRPLSVDSGTIFLEIRFPEGISTPRSPVPQKYTCPKKPSAAEEAVEPLVTVSEEAKVLTTEVPKIEIPVSQAQEVPPEPTLLVAPSVTLQPEEGVSKPLLSPTFTLKYPEGISQPLSPPRPLTIESSTVFLEIKFPEGISMPRSPVPQKYTCPKKEAASVGTSEPLLSVPDEGKVQSETGEPVSRADEVVPEPSLLLPPSLTIQPEEQVSRPFFFPTLTLKYPEGISQPLSPTKPLSIDSGTILLEIKFPEGISVPRSPVPQKYTCPKKPSGTDEASKSLLIVSDEAKVATDVPKIETPVSQDVVPEPTLLTAPSFTLQPEEGITKPLLSPTITLKYPEGISQPLSPPRPLSIDSGTIFLEIRFPEGISMPRSPVPQKYTCPKKPSAAESAPEPTLVVSDEAKVQTEVPKAETPVSQTQEVTAAVSVPSVSSPVAVQEETTKSVSQTPSKVKEPESPSQQPPPATQKLAEGSLPVQSPTAEVVSKPPEEAPKPRAPKKKKSRPRVVIPKAGSPTPQVTKSSSPPVTPKSSEGTSKPISPKATPSPVSPTKKMSSILQKLAKSGSPLPKAKSSPSPQTTPQEEPTKTILKTLEAKESRSSPTKHDTSKVVASPKVDFSQQTKPLPDQSTLKSPDVLKPTSLAPLDLKQPKEQCESPSTETKSKLSSARTPATPDTPTECKSATQKISSRAKSEKVRSPTTVSSPTLATPEDATDTTTKPPHKVKKSVLAAIEKITQESPKQPSSPTLQGIKSPVDRSKPIVPTPQSPQRSDPVKAIKPALKPKPTPTTPKEEKPTVEDSKPTVEDSKPKAEDSKPTAEDSMPTVEDSKPTAEDSMPTVEDSKPTAEVSMPTAEDSMPTVEDSKPTAEDSMPTAEDSKPTAEDSMPTVEDSKPTAEDSMPTVEDSKPTAEDSMPTVEDSKPTAEDSMPTAEDSKPTVEDSMPTVEDSMPTVEDSKPTVEDSMPTVEDSMPTVEDSKPKAEDSMPKAEDSMPTAEDSKPTAEDSKPTAEDSIPTVEDSIPTAEDSKPTAEDSKPTAEDSMPTAEDSMPTAEDSKSPVTFYKLKVEYTHKTADLPESLMETLEPTESSTPAAEEDSKLPSDIKPAGEDLTPPAEVQEQSVVKEPPAEVQEPLIDLKPTAEVQEPTVEVQEETPGVQEGSTKDLEPPAEVQEPPADLKPKAEALEPPAEVEEPPAEVQEAPAVYQEITGDLEAPVDQEPQAKGLEPPVEDVEPTAEVLEPTAVDQEPRAEVQEPTAVDQEPRAEVQEPTAVDQEPRAEVQEPTAVDQEPRAEVQEPPAEDSEGIKPSASQKIKISETSSVVTSITTKVKPSETPKKGTSAKLDSTSKVFIPSPKTGSPTLKVASPTPKVTSPTLKAAPKITSASKVTPSAPKLTSPAPKITSSTTKIMSSTHKFTSPSRKLTSPMRTVASPTPKTESLETKMGLPPSPTYIHEAQLSKMVRSSLPDSVLQSQQETTRSSVFHTHSTSSDIPKKLASSPKPSRSPSRRIAETEHSSSASMFGVRLSATRTRSYEAPEADVSLRDKDVHTTLAGTSDGLHPQQDDLHSPYGTHVSTHEIRLSPHEHRHSSHIHSCIPHEGSPPSKDGSQSPHSGADPASRRIRRKKRR